MRALNKREIVILIICVGLLLVFAFRQLVVLPLWQRSGSIEDQIRLANARLERSRAMVGMKGLVAEQYAKVRSAVGTAGSDAQEMSAVVDSVQSAANARGVHIANIQPQQPMARENAVFFPLALEISGHWSSIVQFIHTLQSSPYHYFLHDMILEKGADPNGALNGRLTFSRVRLSTPK